MLSLLALVPYYPSSSLSLRTPIFFCFVRIIEQWLGCISWNVALGLSALPQLRLIRPHGTDSALFPGSNAISRPLLGVNGPTLDLLHTQTLNPQMLTTLLEQITIRFRSNNPNTCK